MLGDQGRTQVYLMEHITIYSALNTTEPWTIDWCPAGLHGHCMSHTAWISPVHHHFWKADYSGPSQSINAVATTCFRMQHVQHAWMVMMSKSDAISNASADSECAMLFNALIVSCIPAISDEQLPITATLASKCFLN